MGHGTSREDVSAAAGEFEDEAFPPLAMLPADSFTSPDSLTDRVRRMVTDDLGSGSHLDGSAEDLKQNDETVPAVFSWSGGGENVYITGSFNDWSGRIPMHRSSNDFTLILDVPAGKHQYKFLVDDEWRYSPDQPTVNDEQGVVQNEIDVQANHAYDGAFVADENEVYRYGSLIPSAEDYSKDPPMIPPHLGFILLNSVREQAEGDPILPVPQHVTLNHLYASKSQLDRISLLVLASTQRYKTKFVTTVYYKPAESSSSSSVPETTTTTTTTTATSTIAPDLSSSLVSPGSPPKQQPT